MSEIGVVDLADLQSGHRWGKPDVYRVCRAMGWTPGHAVERGLEPPRTLAVVVGGRPVALLRRHWAWIRRAERLIVIAQVEAEAEAELHAFLDEADRNIEYAHGEATDEIRRLLLQGGGDGDAAATAPVADAIPIRDPVAPGPWRDVQVEGVGGVGALASTLCMWRGRPAIMDLHLPEPRLFDLVNGELLTRGAPLRGPAAISDDGSVVLGYEEKGAVYGPLADRRRPIGPLHEQPIFIDPRTGLGAAGTRCWFQWMYVEPEAASLLCAVGHDWPCGHAKKLLGHLDNEPVRIDATRDAYVSEYDVDAIVGSWVGLRWRRAGPVLVPDWPPRDPARALFTCPEWRDGDPRPPEEDSRSDAPAIALGPDASHRYTLGFDREVWRDDVQLEGSGYAVFDVAHQPVRWGTGRLLCGTGPWLWVEHDARVWREDVVTGTREPLIEVDEPIHRALPIRHSTTAVLVQALGKDEEPVRRVPWLHVYFRLRVV